MGDTGVRGHEPDIDGAADEVLKGRPDLRAVLALEPLAREGVRHTDQEDIVLLGDDRGLFEPRFVVALRETELDLAKGGRPQLLEIQWLALSPLEQR